MMMIENEPDPLRRIPTKRPAPIQAEVGAVLRAARLKRGQSLEAVAQQSRIPKRYLEALENDRFDEFPAFVYMRGFLKGYCEHLDVPFDELWAKIEAPAEPPPAEAPAPTSAPAATPSPAPKTPTPKAPAPLDAKRTSAAASVPGPKDPGAPKTAPPHASSSSAAGAIVFAGLLFVGLAVWLFNDRRPAKTEVPEPPKALMPVAKPVETKVGLRAVEDAWVRASVDGAVVFEGRLPRGAAMEWKPSKNVTLRTTSPAALQLNVNGAARPLGAPTPDGEYKIDVP